MAVKLLHIKNNQKFLQIARANERSPIATANVNCTIAD